MAESRAPPENLDARTFTVDAGRLGSFSPSKRQTLPGIALIVTCSHLPGATEGRYAKGIDHGLKGSGPWDLERRRGRNCGVKCR